MKLALVQMTSEKAAVADNVRRMETFLNRAAELSADIICFPEMNITGYVAPRKFPDAVIGWDDPRRMVAETEDWSEGMIVGEVRL